MIGPWLRLLRIGNGFSPIADAAAGASIAGASVLSVTFARTASASLCLYLAGMVLNDWADRAEDAVTRPERPIPRAEISPRAALVLGVSLIAASLLLVPAPGLPVLGVMAWGVLAYDLGVKRWPTAGAVLLGALRAANVLLAAWCLAPANGETSTRAVGYPAGASLDEALCAYFVYVTFLTTLAAHEEDAVPRGALVTLHVVPALAMGIMTFWLPAPLPALALAIPFGAAVVLSLRRALAAWNPRTARASVTVLLIGILVFDAVVCAGYRRYLVAAVILAFVPLARWISRRVAMT